MSAALDTVVVGAGVVGLACAAALARAGREVVVLESGERAGEGTTSRNSGVIHAGLYYAPGSLKAELCVRGRHLLYEYAAAHGVPHRRCGKYVVAVDDDELPALEALHRNASANGVEGLERIDAPLVAQRLAGVRATAALYSPVSGIIDVPSLVTALIAELERHDGQLVKRAEVVRARVTGDGLALELGDGTHARCRRFVNAAGLTAHRLAAAIEGLPNGAVPVVRYARGQYFEYRGQAPWPWLLYPLPQPGGLGTHLTLDLAGGARFGPDVQWCDAPDYRPDPARRDAFAREIARYLPDIDPARLVPGYVGVRPKLHGPDEAAADFRIDGPERHGVAGLVQLFGIESPGLTAALAIGERVSACLADR